MNLYNPLRDSILLLILIIMTIAAYFLMVYFRGKRGTYFGNLQTLEKTHGFRVFHVNSAILIVKLIVVVLLYMLATNSIEVREFQPIADTDYVLLIDVSSSMAKTDYLPNRLSSAKEISNKWLEILPNDTSVGMVAFSQDVDTFIPLTYDKSEVKNMVKDLEINYSKSGTDLDYAINYAIDLLNETSHQKSILLFTDGTETLTNLTISKMQNKEIKLIAFGIGSNNEDELANLKDIPEEFRKDYTPLDLNFTILQNIANKTGGSAYMVSDEIQLKESFDSATMEQTKVTINSGYYVVLLITIISILEFVIYSKFGAL